MRRAFVLRSSELPVFDRGNGVRTTLLVGDEQGAERFISGLTTLPPGGRVPLHLHNCDEQVTVLSGRAQVELDGKRHRLQPLDTTFIPKGASHGFTNASDEPLLILWVYGAVHVTRTFVDSGETVEHLSSGDLTRAP